MSKMEPGGLGGDWHLRREAEKEWPEPVALTWQPDTCLDRSHVRRSAECG